MKNEDITVHTDGGSRGNPGPAASAFVVHLKDALIKEESKYLGIKTNNHAEYTAVLMGAQWLFDNQDKIDFENKTVKFVLDSELVVRQINGIYKVKDENLKIIFDQIKNTLKLIPVKVIFTNVPREENKEADSLVNKELDNVKLSRQ